jgi:UPF0755 protein
MTKKHIRIGALIILFIAPFLVTFVYQFFKLPAEKTIETVNFKIMPGMPLQVIADSLEKKGLIDDAELFIFWITSLGKDRSIKAGYFEIPKNLNYAQLADYLTEARPKEIRVTLIEGLRIEEIAEQITAKLDIQRETFIALTRDRNFIADLGLDAASLEGYLLLSHELIV